MMTVTSILTLKEKIFERRGVTENQDEDTTPLPLAPVRLEHAAMWT